MSFLVVVCFVDYNISRQYIHRILSWKYNTNKFISLLINHFALEICLVARMQFAAIPKLEIHCNLLNPNLLLRFNWLNWYDDIFANNVIELDATCASCITWTNLTHIDDAFAFYSGLSRADASNAWNSILFLFLWFNEWMSAYMTLPIILSRRIPWMNFIAACILTFALRVWEKWQIKFI